jgi:5'-3' exonuclease
LLSWAIEAGIILASSEGAEADDVIAHLARRNPAIIASTDHDFYQLLSEDVSICADAKKEPYRVENLINDLKTLPENYWMVKSLAGDKSDNILGVPRVGEKTAAKICQANDWQWDRILSDERTKDYQERLELNKQLVQFIETEPTLQRQERDPQWLQRFYQQWEFRSLAAS